MPANHESDQPIDFGKNSLFDSLMALKNAKAVGAGDSQLAKERELRQLADSGNIPLLKELLAAGNVNVNAADSGGMTALHYAMNWYPHDPDKDALGVAKVLVEHGADVNAAVNNGQTPIFNAAMYGRFEETVFLVEQGADVNVRLDSGANLLTVIAEELEGRPLNFQVSFQQDGETVTLTDPDAIRAKISSHPDDETAAFLGIAQYLIGQGIDVNAAMHETKQTPLFSAGNRGIAELVAMLLDSGRVDVDCQDKFGLSVLHYASRNGHTAVVRQLLAAGANPNIQEKHGFTPLHEAAENNRVEIAKMLVAANVDPMLGLIRAFDKYKVGDTPLKVANRARRRQVANYLKVSVRRSFASNR